MGQIQIAQAVPEAYRYVAGYVTKKMYEIDGKKANQYYELGQQKPFACMSLKPGLGDHYYKEHKELYRDWETRLHPMHKRQTRTNSALL